MNDNKLSHDVIIIGGGPAGLSAAMLLGRACRQVAVIDAGRPRNVAARKFHGFLGRDGTSPREFLTAAREELRAYSIELVDDVATSTERVITNEKTFATLFRVTTNSGRQLTSRKLLFATGMRDELPEFAGVAECYGLSVHHCPYCDAWEHRGQQLAAYGKQAHAAAGLGLMLRSWSANVTVLTNGGALDFDTISGLELNGIRVVTHRIRHLSHIEGRLQGVEFAHDHFQPFNALFFNTSQRPTCELPRAMGCQCGDEGKTQTSDKQRTSISGVFLAGDADGDVQFVVVAAAEGAQAAVAINRELQDEDRLKQI